MSTSRVTRRGVAAVAALALVVAACGGDDEGADEPVATEPASTEPATTEPATTEPATTEPATTEPATTEPATTEPATTDNVLTVWAEDYYVNIVEPLVGDWEAETGIDVQFVAKDFFEMGDQFVTAVPAGEGPDVFITPSNTNKFVSNGVVAPIELGDAVNDFNPIAISAFSQDGTLYGVPFTVENVAIFRNPELVPEAPATFDELIAAGQALVDAGTAEAPFAIAMDATNGDPYRVFALQASFGSTIFDADGNLTIDDEAGIEFAKALGEWGAAGVINPDISYGLDVELFTSGKLPFLLTGPWDLKAIKDSGIPYAVDPIPSAGGQPAGPLVGFNGVVQSSQAPNPIAASLFLTDFMTRPETQVGIWETGQNPPALTAAFEQVASDPDMAGFGAAGENAVPIPGIPAMDQVWGPWGETQVLILRGQGDPETLWRDMGERIRTAIADAG